MYKREVTITMALCKDEVRDGCWTEGGGLIKTALRLRLKDGASGVVSVTFHASTVVGMGQSSRRFAVRVSQLGQQAQISGDVLDLGTSYHPALAAGDLYFDVDVVGKDVVAYAWSVPKTRWTIAITFDGEFPSG